MSNKVKYGLSNVHIHPVKSESTSAVTYDSAFKLPGAVSLSLDPSGDSNSFFADDIPYYSEFSNNGYSVDFEVAMLNEDFETKILGYVKDTNGAIIENVNAISTAFAMSFEFKGDKKRTRHVLYYCKASRPKTESNTVEEKTKVSTDKLKFDALPHPVTGNIKAKLMQDQEGYETFHTKPYEKAGD